MATSRLKRRREYPHPPELPGLLKELAQELIRYQPTDPYTLLTDYIGRRLLKKEGSNPFAARDAAAGKNGMEPGINDLYRRPKGTKVYKSEMNVTGALKSREQHGPDWDYTRSSKVPPGGGHHPPRDFEEAETPPPTARRSMMDASGGLLVRHGTPSRYSVIEDYHRRSEKAPPPSEKASRWSMDPFSGPTSKRVSIAVRTSASSPFGRDDYYHVGRRPSTQEHHHVDFKQSPSTRVTTAVGTSTEELNNNAPQESLGESAPLTKKESAALRLSIQQFVKSFSMLEEPSPVSQAAVPGLNQEHPRTKASTAPSEVSKMVLEGASMAPNLASERPSTAAVAPSAVPNMVQERPGSVAPNTAPGIPSMAPLTMAPQTSSMVPNIGSEVPSMVGEGASMAPSMTPSTEGPSVAHLMAAEQFSMASSAEASTAPSIALERPSSMTTTTTTSFQVPESPPNMMMPPPPSSAAPPGCEWPPIPEQRPSTAHHYGGHGWSSPPPSGVPGGGWPPVTPDQRPSTAHHYGGQEWSSPPPSGVPGGQAWSLPPRPVHGGEWSSPPGPVHGGEWSYPPGPVPGDEWAPLIPDPGVMLADQNQNYPIHNPPAPGNFWKGSAPPFSAPMQGSGPSRRPSREASPFHPSMPVYSRRPSRESYAVRPPMQDNFGRRLSREVSFVRPSTPEPSRRLSRQGSTLQPSLLRRSSREGSVPRSPMQGRPSREGSILQPSSRFSYRRLSREGSPLSPSSIKDPGRRPISREGSFYRPPTQEDSYRRLSREGSTLHQDPAKGLYREGSDLPPGFPGSASASGAIISPSDSEGGDQDQADSSRRSLIPTTSETQSPTATSSKGGRTSLATRTGSVMDTNMGDIRIRNGGSTGVTTMSMALSLIVGLIVGYVVRSSGFFDYFFPIKEEPAESGGGMCTCGCGCGCENIIEDPIPPSGRSGDRDALLRRIEPCCCCDADDFW